VARTARGKLEVKVTIDNIRELEGDYGTSWLCLLRDEDGNFIKWFCSSSSAVDVLLDAEKRQVLLKGTIKGHEEYKGKKQTQVTRCKVYPLTVV
jgi:hypothetical protein